MSCLSGNITDILKNPRYSRSNIDTSADEGHWIWWSGDIKDPQFQASNCIKCGGYNHPYTNSHLVNTVTRNRLLCTCTQC